MDSNVPQVIRLIEDYYGSELITPHRFGAKGDGVTDDTAAIQTALEAVKALASVSYGGGTLYFPPGYYRCTGTLEIDKSFVNILGAGPQSSYLEFSNGGSDCIVIGTTATATRCQSIVGMALNGSGKTGGATVKYRNTYNTLLERVQIEGCITGVDVGANTNSITISDAVIIPNQAGSLHGIKWMCLGDGTERSDVLTLNNVTITGQWSDATGIYWDGLCNTLEATHVRVLNLKYGLRIRNTAASASHYPQFMNAFDFTCEGFKSSAILIEGGGDFKIVGSDITNASGAFGQGGADTHAVEIQADAGASVTRGVQIDTSLIGSCRSNGVYTNARATKLTNNIFFSTSASGAGNAAAVRVGAAAQNTQVDTMTAEQYGGLTFASYGVQVDNGSFNTQLSGIDGTYCQTGAVLDNSAAGTTSVGARIDPGNKVFGPRLNSLTVAQLAALGGFPGDKAYATDGRKAGEGGGAGTGVEVFHDSANWIAVDTGATVAA